MGRGTTGSKVKSQIEILAPQASCSASFQTQGRGPCAAFDDGILAVLTGTAVGGATVQVNYQISLDYYLPSGAVNPTPNWATVDSSPVISTAVLTLKRIAAPIGQVYRLDVAITGTSIPLEIRADFGIRG